MAKKKRKPKKLNTPASLQDSSPTAKKKSLAARIATPRALSTFAFGLSGLLAGLFTGLNHFPALGQTAAIPRMMLLAAYLGDPHVDVVAGLTTALAGLMIGACLGFSALSSPRDLGISVLLSVAFAVLAITTTGNVLLAGLGFLAGHSPAIMSYIKLRHA
jgi:hypothetical protein